MSLCLNYHSLAISFKIEKQESSYSIRLLQDFLAILGSSHFHNNLNHLVNFDEKFSWDSDRECTEAADETEEYYLFSSQLMFYSFQSSGFYVKFYVEFNS